MLTDTPSFEGAPQHMVAARAATPLPVLRKDFLYDHYQVAESRALGADCILIIMAAVDDKTARELFAAAIHWNMDALLEVHDERELDRALAIGSRLIGINNRDLRTFETNLATTERLAPRVPKDKLVVGESGIFTPRRHRAAGRRRLARVPGGREPDARRRRDCCNTYFARTEQGQGQKRLRGKWQGRISPI